MTFKPYPGCRDANLCAEIGECHSYGCKLARTLPTPKELAFAKWMAGHGNLIRPSLRDAFDAGWDAMEGSGGRRDY
jgi:hypothetical protein